MSKTPLDSDPALLERTYVQFLQQVDDLYVWRFKRRLSELRGTKSDDWIGGHHVPSQLWGGIAMLCWLCDELWQLQASPWDIKKEAEKAAYEAFRKEVLDGQTQEDPESGAGASEGPGHESHGSGGTGRPQCEAGSRVDGAASHWPGD